jgi:hypothetical protein
MQELAALPRPERLDAATSLDTHPAVFHLRCALRDCLPACEDVAIANIAWAHSVVPLGPSDLPKLMLAELNTRETAANGRTVSSVLRLCVRAGVQPCRKVLSAVVHRAVQGGLGAWSTRSLSSFAWALASLDMHGKEVFAAIAGAAAARMEQLSMHDLCLLVWALVKSARSRSAASADILSHTASCVLRLSPIMDHALSGSFHEAPDSVALTAKDRSQLLWAFAAESERRARHRFGAEPLHATCTERRAAMLQQSWPEVPVLAVLSTLMRQSTAVADTQQV